MRSFSVLLLSSLVLSSCAVAPRTTTQYVWNASEVGKSRNQLSADHERCSSVANNAPSWSEDLYLQCMYEKGYTHYKKRRVAY